MSIRKKADMLKQKITGMKKEDYIALVLLGILLVVIALPTGEKKETASDNKTANKRTTKEETISGTGDGSNVSGWIAGTENGTSGGESGTSGAGSGSLVSGEIQSTDQMTYETLKYTDDMEQKLKNMLEQIEGVGKVSVMITVSESGKDIIEKDVNVNQQVKLETDSQGGTRNDTQSQEEKETVFTVNDQGENVPMIVQKQMPQVKGVLVIAQGAGKNSVKENIIQAVKVLFDISEHNIKVITMKS